MAWGYESSDEVLFACIRIHRNLYGFKVKIN
jgi:hypothetical protein